MELSIRKLSRIRLLKNRLEFCIFLRLLSGSASCSGLLVTSPFALNGASARGFFS